MYYANGSYYDPEVGVHVDASSISSIINNAFEVFGLDINGIMCDNILAYLPYVYSTFTTRELSANPLYDPDANKPWWELAWNAVVAWFASVVQWFNNLDVGWKIGIGLALFALACIITAITAGLSGGAAAIAPALLKVFLDFAIGVVSAFAFTAISMAITGDFSLETLGGAVADAIFWGGVFAFVSASVNAVKAGIRGIKTANKPCNTPGNCFIAGTLVLTEDGYKPIEEIQIGDKVLAYNDETGEQEYKTVVHLFRGESKKWIGVTVNGKEIVSTPGHKYFLPKTKEWVSAQDLKPSTKVLLSDGKIVAVEAVRFICYEQALVTYNFEVEDFHTYYVSNGVLVHNKNCELTPGTKEWKKAVKDIKNSADNKGKLNYTVKNQQTAEKLMREAGLPFKGNNYVHDDILEYAIGFEKHRIDNPVGLPHFKFWSGRTNGHVYWLS